MTELELVNYFLTPTSQRQKQYEAVRAFALKEGSSEEIANRYGYKKSTGN